MHFCDEHYDTGPILSQSIVRVHPLDDPKSLAARVLQTVRHIMLCNTHRVCHRDMSSVISTPPAMASFHMDIASPASRLHK